MEHAPTGVGPVRTLVQVVVSQLLPLLPAELAHDATGVGPVLTVLQRVAT